MYALANLVLGKGVLDDAAVNDCVQRSNDRLKRDHEVRHAFVAEQVLARSRPHNLSVILYGSDHMKTGAESVISPAPLEEYFPDHRVLVFQPHNETEKKPPEDGSIWLQEGRVHGEEIRNAVVEIMKTAKRKN